MSRYDAPSDIDYYNEIAHGHVSETVDRECAVCHRMFAMETGGEYVMHPACDRCVSLQQERNERAKAEQEAEPIERRQGERLGAAFRKGAA